MRHSISCMDCSDLISIEQIVLRILVEIYGENASASAAAFAENVCSIGLFAVKSDDDPAVHFVFCKGVERTRALFEKIKFGLAACGNWSYFMKHERPLSRGEHCVTWKKQADGVNIALQIELVYLRLTQLLKIALRPGSDFLTPEFEARQRSEFSGHKLFTLLEP
jgi:hypothetical protein